MKRWHECILRNVPKSMEFGIRLQVAYVRSTKSDL